MFKRGKGAFPSLQKGDFLADRGQLFRKDKTGCCHVDPLLFAFARVPLIPENFAKSA